MTLNAVRGRIEAAFAAREQELRRAELDRRLTEDVVDVTLPGEERPLGTLHPSTLTRRVIEDAFLGLGYEVIDDREVETVHYNFDQLAFPPAHPTRSPRDTFFLDSGACSAQGRRRRRSTCWRRRAAYLHGLDRPGVPARRDHGDPLPDLPPVRGLAVDRHITLSDLKGTLLHRARWRGSPRSLHARPSPSPSRRSSRTSRARSATWRLPHVQVHGLGRARRRGDGRPTGLRQRRARPGGVDGLRLRLRDRARRSSATGSPRSRRSGRTTCAC